MRRSWYLFLIVALTLVVLAGCNRTPARTDAQVASDVQNKNWSQLADGTPLITAAPLGQGWVVMFHITASPTWSSLPLSGLYVDMLKRLLALSAGTPVREMAGLTSLPPVSLLDGFGHPEAPAADAAPISAREFSKTRVSPRHPPGLYGAHEVESALNVMRTGDRLSPLTGASQAYANDQPSERKSHRSHLSRFFLDYTCGRDRLPPMKPLL